MLFITCLGYSPLQINSLVSSCFEFKGDVYTKVYMNALKCVSAMSLCMGDKDLCFGVCEKVFVFFQQYISKKVLSNEHVTEQETETLFSTSYYTSTTHHSILVTPTPKQKYWSRNTNSIGEGKKTLVLSVLLLHEQKRCEKKKRTKTCTPFVEF